MTKQLRDGRTVEMVVSEDGAMVAITLAGLAMPSQPAIVRPVPGGKPAPYYVGTIGLLADEAASLKAEIEAARAAYASSPIGQAWAARRTIEAAWTRGQRLEDEDYGAYLHARHAYTEALKAWAVQYPEAARKEQRDRLMDAAQDLRRKATDALCYDMDGSLSSADQQCRHDEYIQEAEAKEREAEAL